MMMSSYSRRKFIVLSGALGAIQAFSSFRRNANAKQLVNDMTDLEKIKKLLKQEDPVIWLFTGDSITQGAKHTAGYRSYPEIFAERVRWEMPRRRDVIINTAISGNVAENIINDFQWRVEQFKPAVVSLMIGTNDAAYPAISPEIFETNLRSFVNKIRSIGAVPVLHTPNCIKVNEDPQRLRLPAFIPVIRKVAEDNKIILVDNWSYWTDAKNNASANPGFDGWLDDPVHPNHKGHSEIAKLLFKTLDIFDVNAFTCQ